MSRPQRHGGCLEPDHEPQASQQLDDHDSEEITEGRGRERGRGGERANVLFSSAYQLSQSLSSLFPPNSTPPPPAASWLFKLLNATAQPPLLTDSATVHSCLFFLTTFFSLSPSRASRAAVERKSACLRARSWACPSALG